MQHSEHLSLILRGRRRVSFCVAGAALGAPQSHFPWQVQHAEHLQRGLRKSGDNSVLWTPAAFAKHLEHLSLILRGGGQHLEHLSFILRGRCSTRSTSRGVRRSPATIEYCGRRLRLRGRHSTWSTSVSFCVAGGSTWSTSVLFCAAGAARGAPPEGSAEVRRRLSTVDAGCVCVAGTALGAPQSHFAWRGAALGAPQSYFARQVQHAEHLSFILRGRCSTRSTSVSFCVAGAARGAPQERSAEVWRRLSTVFLSFKGSCSIILPFCTSTHHHLHNTIYTPPSTLHRRHNTIYTTSSNTTSSAHTIYTTSSTQHRQHNLINTSPSK